MYAPRIFTSTGGNDGRVPSATQRRFVHRTGRSTSCTHTRHGGREGGRLRESMYVVPSLGKHPTIAAAPCEDAHCERKYAPRFYTLLSSTPIARSAWPYSIVDAPQLHCCALAPPPRPPPPPASKTKVRGQRHEFHTIIFMLNLQLYLSPLCVLFPTPICH